MTDHLLLVAHEGYRNGANRVLLALLERMSGSIPGPVRVRVLADGPLSEDLRSFGTEPDINDGSVPRAVVVNSALAAGELLGLPADVPSLVYVYEVGDALKALTSEAKQAVRSRADLVIAVSSRGRADLLALGVPPDKLMELPPLVTVSQPLPAEVAEARAELLQPGAEHLVVACGEVNWRKGPDLFVDLRRRLGHRPDITLAWVGRRNRSMGRVLDHDGTATVGNDCPGVVWFGEVDDAVPYLAAADLVVLPSREDPFPLVPVEAALVGTATVLFGGTGLDALADHGGAVTVPYPDVAAMADEVSRLLGDRVARHTLADVAVEYLREHRDPVDLTAKFVATLAMIDCEVVTER